MEFVGWVLFSLAGLHGVLAGMGASTTRGYSLTGKTAILHIVILGSSPNISNWFIYMIFKLDWFV